MPVVYIAPGPINSTQLIPGGSTPASGGKLFQYLSGSSTKTDTYTNVTGTVKWSNPIILDSGGNLGGSNEVWIPAGVTAKFVLAPSNDTDPPIAPYKTWDNLSGINDPTSLLTEWVVGPTPTFISTTSFTLVGDQTLIFTPGRRVKTTNTAGTRYGTISTSVFGALTTVTIINDSGTLDAGLSAVWYGILSVNHDSIPNVVSVMRFGALGDGVTDDTAAINLVEALPASVTYIYVPDGTYITTLSSLSKHYYGPGIISLNGTLSGPGASGSYGFGGSIPQIIFTDAVAVAATNPIGAATRVVGFIEASHTLTGPEGAGEFAIGSSSAHYLSLFSAGVRLMNFSTSGASLYGHLILNDTLQVTYNSNPIISVIDSTGTPITTVIQAAHTIGAGEGVIGTGSNHALGIYTNSLNRIGITAAGAVAFNYITTTVSAANAFLDGAANNNLLRSTSSVRYKKNIEELDLESARKIILSAKPIVYEAKDGGRRHIGLSAEQMAEIDERMVTLDADGKPDWVQYPHLTSPIILFLQDIEKRLSGLERECGDY